MAMFMSRTLSTNCSYFEQTHDAAGTLERMPHHHVRERLILKALHHHGYNKVSTRISSFS